MRVSRRIRRLVRGEPEPSPFECGYCETGYELDRQVCPNCGSFTIRRTQYDDLIGGD